MSEQRFYYKSKDGKVLLNLKTPLEETEYEQITKEEFIELGGEENESE